MKACCDDESVCQKCVCSGQDDVSDQGKAPLLFYLRGMHTVKLMLSGQQISQPFRLMAYRIR